MVDVVEGPGQVCVQDPPALAAVAAQRLEDDLDRVVATAARPEPVTAGLEPGLPLWLQRILHACLLHAIGDHRNPERALLAVGFRYEHPPDGQRLSGRGMAVHSLRQVRPVTGGQGDLSVDTRRLAASIALRYLPHADQRVAAAPQHELLQVAGLLQVTVLRRLEDPLPQPPYAVLVGRPVNGIPVRCRVLRSVHIEGRHRQREHVSRHLRPTCPSVPALRHQSVKGSPGPRQLPFGPGRYPYPAGYAGRPRRERPRCPGFPLPFGAPALASWTVLCPPGNWAFLTVGLPGQRPDPDGVVTFRTAETRPGWVPSAPRGGGVLSAGS